MIKKIAIFARTLNEEAISMEQNLTFADLGLSEEILQALEKKGYGYPTRIQAEAIPEFMSLPRPRPARARRSPSASP